MAESSWRMKSKESKSTKKTKLRYVRDEEESDDDRLELGLLDVEPYNFNPTSNLCNDPFLNILCDDKMLKNNQFEGDDGADVEDIHQEEHEHEHLEDENGLEVGVEFRVHDPIVKWNQMKPTVGKLYESPTQLRFALTNYVVANGYQLWFMKSDKSRDDSCLLMVDVAANVVAKETIMKYSVSGEKIQVMTETSLQGEALLLTPLEEKFIVKVKDTLGQILSWPRDLVIRYSELVSNVDSIKVQCENDLFGRHRVLVVLDMKMATCYYLDSMSSSNVNLQLKQIIDSQCALQPEGTECGYYMLKFIKEIVQEGIEVLVNDNVGGGKVQYIDDDIDVIRKEWLSFVTGFIYQ
ncbi:unnamed protein product [Lactuca saligna]|uniref:Ubiquitin-like protease family profile domain-containing protein n=1 Tax=Lactuca saligna TaxID=75948 RepID=A0AA35ZXL0_LACSI|nr:unnamed protein product [Lactuca saligna]